MAKKRCIGGAAADGGTVRGGRRSRAGAVDAGSLPAAGAVADAAVWEGVCVEEAVMELHVRRGLPLPEVARSLGLELPQVRGLWRTARAGLAAGAPQAEEDFTVLREQIGAVLWQTVECTFPPAVAGVGAAAAAGAAGSPMGTAGCELGQMVLPMTLPARPAEPPSAPMLTVRLRALDQLTKLYDVGLSRPPAPGADDEEGPYSTPAEIAEKVRARLLEIHGRAGFKVSS